MINKVTKIKIIEGIYPLPVTLFQFSPLFEDKYEYLTGAFYGFEAYPQVALYESTEKGIIINDIPVILEEGILTFEQLFKNNGYTLID